MVENNLKNLGETINSIRMKLDINQKQLAEGICSQSQISKIESGEISPYIHTLIKISKKLGINPSYFINQVYKDQFEFIAHSKELVREAIRKKDYKEVKRLIGKFEKHKCFQEIEEVQFLEWHKGIVTYYLDQNFTRSIEILEDTFQLKDSIQHTEQDIQILNSLAIIYSEEQQWENAKHTFIEAIEVYKKSIFITDTSILVRLYYNLGKLLYEAEEYKESLVYCDKGIAHCKQYHSNYLFGELLYQKGMNLLKLDGQSAGQVFLEESLFLFKLLDKEQNYEFVKEKIASLS